jgi:N-acetyl-anhydromuramyl-L-alanine amidase AmpD
MKTVLTLAFAVVFITSCVLADKAATVKPLKLQILTRAAWDANPPVAEMKAHKISRITIHHTATLQKPERSLADKMKALQAFSQNPGTLGNGKAKPAWPDVPYHFYIDCHGEIAEGRDANYVGDTNTAYDPAGHLLVVLEGNFEEETPTELQLTALRTLLTAMQTQYRIASDRIASHKDFAETLCPGKRLHELIPSITKQAGEK